MKSFNDSIRSDLFEALLGSLEAQAYALRTDSDTSPEMVEAEIEALKTICFVYRYSFPRPCDCESVPDSFSKGIDFGPGIGIRKCCKCIDWFRPYEIGKMSKFWLSEIQKILQDIKAQPDRIKEMTDMNHEGIDLLIRLFEIQENKSLDGNQGI